MLSQPQVQSSAPHQSSFDFSKSLETAQRRLRSLRFRQDRALHNISTLASGKEHPAALIPTDLKIAKTAEFISYLNSVPFVFNENEYVSRDASSQVLQRGRSESSVPFFLRVAQSIARFIEFSAVCRIVFDWILSSTSFVLLILSVFHFAVMRLPDLHPLLLI